MDSRKLGETKKNRDRNLVKHQEKGGSLEDPLSIINEKVKLLEEDIKSLYNEWFIDKEPPWDAPQSNEEVKKLLETFNVSLRNFNMEIEPYLNKEETKA